MQEHFGQSMNLTCIKLMALLLLALCVVQTVSLPNLPMRYAHTCRQGRDVGSIAQQVRSTTVTGAVPGDVFLDTGACDPVAKSLQTHGVARERQGISGISGISIFILGSSGRWHSGFVLLLCDKFNIFVLETV